MDTSDRKQPYRLEAERLEAERLDALRLLRNKQTIREAKARHNHWEGRRAAETSLKIATLYDGLGNVEAAIKEYESFLAEHGEIDESLAQFVRHRIGELQGQR